MKNDARRKIPSVDKLMSELACTDIPRAAVAAVVRRELDALRSQKQQDPARQAIERVRSALHDLRLGRIQPVINGTGILLHTNFGRAPLALQVVKTIEENAANYDNLEYDLTSGRRGTRAAYLEHNLAVLCGAQAATVVNNGAAALVLVLRLLTQGQKNEVIVSRGELIQIGGGFRIPEILEASGAVLREVGTTNKTALNDFAKAIGKQAALILKVHRSNFYMDGFVESPALEDLSALARKKRIPLIEDLGSGAMIATEQISGLEHEPTPRQVLRQGADIVCFSGDKLLGGPQAGIIAGKARLITALKRHPLYRALRCDKLILSALQATVDLHLCNPDSIPVIAMLRESTETLQRRAGTIVESLKNVVPAEIGAGKAPVGGGTLPRSVLASTTIDLLPSDRPLEQLASDLRSGTPPVVGYISANRLKIDLRTVFPRQDEQLASLIRQAMQNPYHV